MNSLRRLANVRVMSLGVLALFFDFMVHVWGAYRGHPVGSG